VPGGNLLAMTEPAPVTSEPVVVVPAGAPLVDAAPWIGHVCWAELELHRVLTGWLAVEADPAAATLWWAVRAHRAELAEAWHRRLPELRELPRAGFVEPSPVGEGGLASRADLDAPSATAERRAALGDALGALADHYRRHRSVAVGPADGPTAETLARAVSCTEADLARVRA
jgi:hypothetical protein